MNPHFNANCLPRDYPPPPPSTASSSGSRYDSQQHQSSSPSSSSPWQQRKDHSLDIPNSQQSSSPDQYMSSDVLYSHQQQYTHQNPNNNMNPDSLRNNNNQHFNNINNEVYKHYGQHNPKEERFNNNNNNGNKQINNNNNNNSNNVRPNITSIPSILRMHDSRTKTNGISDEMITLQDWVHKRSSSLQLVWKRRWCVLRDSRIYYYRSNTDTKPLGILNLSEYSILTSGPDVTRKSKYAFKISSPHSIPNQSQSHVFFLDSAKSLENWVYSIQIHINQAMASLIAMAEASTRLDIQLKEAELNRLKYGLGADGELSIIDKVLDRLNVDDPALSESTGSTSSHYYDRETQLSNLPTKFMQTYTDNTETWSSVSSIQNTSSNTSSNLDYIFNLNQQQQQQQQQQHVKSSLDSIRDPQNAYHKKTTSSVSQSSSLNPGYHHFHQQAFSEALSVSSMSEDGRSTRQSIDSQGLQNRGVINSTSSPRLHPSWNGPQSSLSIDNHSSPGTSTVDSPYSSPTLKPNTLAGLNNGAVPASPRTFYRIIESSKENGSNSSTTSISSIGSSADASTVLESITDSTTATENSQSTKQSGSSLFMGLVGGAKHRKEKEKDRHGSGSMSSSSGSSPGMKLFSSAPCPSKGCEQPAKTCTEHGKKKKHKEKDQKKPLRLWTSNGDKSSTSGSQNGSERSISPVPNGGKPRTSKSMVSLTRESEFSFEKESVPALPNNMLGIFNSNARRRSPSVSVLDDALIAAQARYQQHHQQNQNRNLDGVAQQQYLSAVDSSSKSPSPLLLNPPTHPLPPTPQPTVPSIITDTESVLPDKNNITASVQDGSFFIANHHRTMQKLQEAQTRKPQSVNTNDLESSLFSPVPITPATRTFDPQMSMALGGVSRHIIAPDQLAQAIEQETEEMRKQQEQSKQLQRIRPTSIVHNNQTDYSLLPSNTNLSTVEELSSESNVLPEEVPQHSVPCYAAGEDPECGRIISCQEQLACGSAAIPNARIQQVARQRSPISGIISDPIPQLSNLTLHPNHASGVMCEANPKASPVPANFDIEVPLKSPVATNISKVQPLAKRSYTFGDNKEPTPFHSLPPPRRPGHMDDKTAHPPRGSPRRSSAAAAVGTPSTPLSSKFQSGYFSSVEYDQDGNTITESNNRKSTPISPSPISPGVSGVFRPVYSTRRNSSSPVLIRLGEQGVQDISPLLTNGATRTFPGEGPSADVRRPGIMPVGSPSGSSRSVSMGTATPSKQEGESEECQQFTGLALGAITPDGMSPNPDNLPASPMALNNARRFKGISSPSPLAHVVQTGISSHPASPIGSPSESVVTRMALPEEDGTSEYRGGIPSVVVNCPQGATLSKTGSPKHFAQPAHPYVFPAPLPGSSTYSTDVSSNDRSPSSRTSMEEPNSDHDQEQSTPSSPVIPASALRAHAAALDLYPGLRKLSLFTAAVGGVPPPALISGRRKGSAESASTRKMSTTSSLSKMSDDDHDDDDDDESVDLQHDDDWAGNFKSVRGVPLPAPSSKRRPSLPMLGNRLPSAPPTAPLPPLPSMTTTAAAVAATTLDGDGKYIPRPTTPNTFTSPSSLQFVSGDSEIVYTSQLKPPPPSSPINKSYSGFNPLNGAGSPPAIPKRSVQRSAPSSPTPVRSPRSIEQTLLE